MNKIKAYFGIDGKKTTVSKEVIGGLVTFLSMSYILFVNPDMLAAAAGEGMFNAIFTATAVSAALTTILMGVFAKLPIALAPGMGLNAFFTFNVALYGMELGYFPALAVVFVSGILFLVLSLTGARTHLINAIPKSMKLAMGAGIGLFIAFIGLANAGIVQSDPATLVSIGDFSQPTVLLAAFGICLAVALHVKKVPGGILIAMLGTAIVGVLANQIFFSGDHAWLIDGDWMASLPTFDNGLKVKADFGGMFGIPGKMFGEVGTVLTSAKGWAAILIFLFVDFFDTAGTIVAVGHEAGLVTEDGELDNADKALLADAIGTVGGAMIGTSTVTSYIESGTGVAAGGKTGFSAVITGASFLLALLIFPFIFPLITGQVTALALIMVGALMFGQLKDIDWNDEAITVSSFFMITLMPLTYAIYWGIVAAFIVYAVVKIVKREEKEVSIPMWILAGLSLLFFIIEFVILKNV